MFDWNPYEMSELSWEVLKLFIKFGHGEIKLYSIPFFESHLSDETVLLTLQEFYEKAINYEGILWSEISPL